MKMMRFLFSAIIPVLLGACSTAAPDAYLTTQAVNPVAPPIATDVSPDYAAAYLPTLAGGIVSVRQTVRKDYLHQEIVYQNLTALAGENQLTVDVGVPQNGATLRPPSEGQVAREIRSAFPGANVSMSGLIRDNPIGAYGYATGPYGTAGACLYAWQFVKSVNPADSDGIDLLTRQHLSATIRLRYCHPSITPDRITALMDGLMVKEINSHTIDLLRFAAGSAHVAAPEAVVTPEPVLKKRKTVRQASATQTDDDWKSATTKPVVDTATPVVMDNAAAVPLPDDEAEKSAPASADDAVIAPVRKITNAVDVPLPD
jgi:hypothetical protein